MKKRMLSAFLSLCMMLTMLPVTALAVSDDDWDDMLQYYEQFQQEYGAGDLQWSTLGNAALNYNIVTDNDANLTEEQTATLQTITEYFGSITELDMSGKSAGIMAGALPLLGNLETLNISNTGVEDLGGLATLTNLKSLDVSDNPDVDDLGALAACTQITELNLSGTGIDSNDFGALVQMPLGSLDMSNTQISSIGPLTTNGNSPACADTLEELNISNTDVTQLQEVWNGSTQSSSLPNLKTLTAQGLELSSISGLVEIVNKTGFDPKGISWNLSGSTLTDTTNGVSHVNQILSKLGNSGSFVAPSQEGGIPASVSSAQNWKNALLTALGADGGKENLTWDTLITAVYWYETATREVNAMSNDSTKTTCNSILDSIKTAFKGIETLDMSDKSDSQYTISTGALIHFTGLTDLNLSNTGISDTGGLSRLTALKKLDLSDNRGIDNENFGALVSMDSLEELNLSGTGITDIGGLTGADGNGVADTLTTLDISNTGVTKLESIWGADTATFPAFSALNNLTAQGLALESISGLARIAEQTGFNASDYTWDLSGSTLTGTAANGTNLAAIQEEFSSSSSNFSSPTYTASVAEDLTKAQSALDDLEAELENDDKASWDTLITAVYYYQQAQNYVNGLTEGEEKTAAQTMLTGITNGFAAITTLDMSDQNTSRYTISTGALEPFTGLTSLNLSNTGISDTGGLAGLTELETLNLSGNTGINNTHFGALAGMNNLKELNLSGTGITDIGGLTGTSGSGVADTLTTLDISNTGVTRLESVWDGTASASAFPRLTTLVAQGLNLESISGLVEISNVSGFNADSVTWDLSGSSLTNIETNIGHVSELREAFAYAGTFNPPTIPVENMPQALESALSYKDGFNDAVANGQLDWDYLITAIYWFRTAENSWTGLTNEAAKTQCETTWNDIKAFYANITELDMSNQSDSDYEISTGALTDFVGLTDLNLSNTGITELGGLAELTSLTTLDVSDNDLSTTGTGGDDLGALSGLTNLTTLDISGNAGLTDLGGLPNMDFANRLTTLDVSGTGIVDMNFMWKSASQDPGAATEESAFPALKTLTAQNLTLDSISGLVEIVSQTGFDGSELTWNLGGSTMPESNSHGDDNQNHINIITAKLGDQFTPPTVEMEEPVTYTVTVMPSSNGTVTVNTDEAAEGETVVITATPNANYEVDSITVVDSNGTSVTVTNNSFTMPGSDVTVTVTFKSTSNTGGNGGGGGGSSSCSYTVSVAFGIVNGKVTVSPKSASKGDTVTITVTPDSGFELDTLTVTDKNGDKISVTDKGNGKYTFTMPSGKVTIDATFTEITETPETPDPIGSFTDVNTDDWFADAVQYMLDNNMMNGTSDTTFSPSTTTTRGMIVTILYRLEGEPDAAASSFTDVASNMYYADAINWAAANGIVNGITTTTFGPDNAITREQMAAILYRYAQHKGYDVTACNDLGSYTDASQISAYATTAMQWANAEGLITGNTTTTINPIGNATRAEIATILMRFCENIAG